MNRLSTVLSISLVLTSCVSKYVEDDDELASTKIDILLIVDNSDSMSDEAEQLTQGIDQLFWNNLDYQIGITTTSDVYNQVSGFTLEPDPGEVGLLVGSESVVSPYSTSPAYTTQQNIACWATCWHGYEMPSDPEYAGTAGDCQFPEDGAASVEYLDCLCRDVEYPVDSADWDDGALCGSGIEKPIEAALQSLCRSVPYPPEACNHDESAFEPERDTLANPDWLRDDATLLVIILTDEGDSSDLFGTGEDDPTPYLEAFAEFARPIKFVVIGPDLSCDENNDCELNCNSGGATPNGILRLQNIVEATGGMYRPITNGSEADDDCESADFTTIWYDLSQLMAG